MKDYYPSMKFKILLVSAFWILIFSVSCKSDDLEFGTPAKSLRFSRDTLKLDTVYHQVRSETYAVKVYNEENQDVVIPQISLEAGGDSPYRINIDGKAGTAFQNIPLRKKDSLFIFVEIAPKAVQKEALAQDRILFQTASEKKAVTLLSVVQDAEFFIQSSTNANILTENTEWTDDKAKIIYGKLTVAEGKSLNIKAGTKVYFTRNSSLWLSKGASLNIEGNLNKEVILRGDRNDTRYDTIPLNWKGIDADEGATIVINYAKIFGGETGLSIKSATARISNTIIHSFQEYGIKAVASNITASNLVMNSFGQAAVGIFKGGNADFKHCTLANFWNMRTPLPAKVLYASNEWQNPSGATETGPLSLSVKNCILYGEKDDAVTIKAVQNQTAVYFFESSILKVGSSSGFAFENNPNVVNALKNVNPKFINTTVSKLNLRVATDSPAKGKGNAAAAQAVPLDLLNTTRTTSPTIGAYQ